MIKKRLIINKDVIEEKSFEEVYRDYQPFINAKVCKWKRLYEEEELKSVCNFYLWKAYDNYKIEKEVRFINYASVVIDHGLFDEVKKSRRNNNDNNIISLSLAVTFEDSNTVELFETIADKTDYSDVAANNVMFQKVSNSLEGLEKKVFVLYYQCDMMQSDISKELGIHRSYVSKILSNIQQKAIKLF